MNPSVEDFATLLEASNFAKNSVEGHVVKGRVISVEKDFVTIDVGLKVEGRVHINEFKHENRELEITVGSEIDVFLGRIENNEGEAMLSYQKARREASWEKLHKMFEANEHVNGTIFGNVKGGFTVDLDGTTAFLPGSQVDIRPVRDITPLMNIEQPFQILKMDRHRENIVVSRRAIMEVSRADDRNKIIQNLVEGQKIEGIVKNITDYGAFIDLGGIDGLLHVIDISWKRINHPSDILTLGEKIEVQVIKINYETMRVNLGKKQLDVNPWDGIEEKFPLNTRCMGRVTNITDYGAFVLLEDNIEGLVHVSEMSWVKKNVHPGKIVSTSQQVEVMILEIDSEKRRISLGLKQCVDNPWNAFVEQYPINTKIKGEIKNITEFGLFIGLNHEIDGMVHVSDLDWNMSHEEVLATYHKGQEIEAVIIDVDPKKERISLGIKQLSSNTMKNNVHFKRGKIVTCTVINVTEAGLEVTVGDDSHLKTFIRRNELSRDREDQRPDKFTIGNKLDAMITNVSSKTNSMTLSIKALEIAEEKEAVAQYGSSDSGASLGEILGSALSNKENK